MNDKAEETKRLNAKKKALQEEYEKNLRAMHDSQPDISPLSSQAQEQDNHEPCALNVDIKNPEAFIKAYNLIAKNDDGTYKDGFSEVKVNPDGSREFSFPSPEEAGDFFEARAKARHAFVLKDKMTGDLIATSKGDGHMYRPDGTVFGSDEFKQTITSIFENRKNDEQSMSPTI